MKKLILFLLIALSSLLMANDILMKTLPNGMEVAVKENDSNESVGFYAFVKTGSVNEGDYLGAGISHYLEHVVSSGTTKMRTEAEYQQIGKDIGAIVNAYTTYGITAFHVITDNSYSDLALEILSEQLQYCAIDSFEVEREKNVILKEIVMRSTPTPSKIYQRWQELVFPNSNRKYPVIGYTNLFKTITRDEYGNTTNKASYFWNEESAEWINRDTTTISYYDKDLFMISPNSSTINQISTFNPTTVQNNEVQDKVRTLLVEYFNDNRTILNHQLYYRNLIPDTLNNEQFKAEISSRLELIVFELEKNCFQ